VLFVLFVAKSSNFFLKPFGFLYSAIVEARRALYEKGFFKTHDFGIKTVSIGNITVGGTGKTPLVAFVARVLAASGEKVCVLTRGYGRENPTQRVVVSDGEKILSDAAQAGDEPFELAHKLLGAAVVIADANRAAAGNFARENFGATAFVLDDAFQHFQVARDLDIVTIDATNPFGNAEILPAGILRESLPNLKRADAVIITRANLVDEKKIADLKFRIANLCPAGKIFVAENRVANVVNLENFANSDGASKSASPAIFSSSRFKIQSSEPDGFQPETLNLKPGTKRFFAFCALGNPENFFAQLRREGFDLVSTKTFRDHRRYTQKDVDELEREAKTSGAEIFLTTAKDAVKLTNLKFETPCFVVESEMVFDDETAFREMILKVKRSRLKLFDKF
jgi:tetraacyldisaccharide 4'-kinase